MTGKETSKAKNDLIFTRLFKNSKILLSGNLFVSVLGLITFVITVKALGTEVFGLFVLVTTYIAIVDRLVNFQAWRALIKYGAEALNAGRRDDVKALVKICSAIDIFSAVLAFSCSVVGLFLVGYFMDWPDEITKLVLMYSFVLLFRLSGTPTAILRIFDKFKTFAYRGVVSAILKLSGTLIVYFQGGGLFEYLLIWAITDIIGQLLLVFAGWKELHNQGLDRIYIAKTKNIKKRYPGFYKFILFMSFDSTIYVGRDLDIYIIGALVSLDDVALFKVAKQLASILGKLIDPVYTAIYPELAKMHHRSKISQFNSLIKKTSATVGIVILLPLLVYGFFGKQLLLLVFGDDYVKAFIPGLFCISSMVVWGFAQPLAPALLSMDKPKVSFAIHMLTTLSFLALLSVLIPSYGIVGAGISHFLFYFLWSLSMLSAVIYFNKKIYEES
tara:strand:- start:4222 stop:5550 length:1329 start_codon:yes stop_codon:yes gene_type:complete